MKYSAIILAAGKGVRTGLDYNKNLIKIHNKYLIEYSLDFFFEHDNCDEIILVVSSEDYDYFSKTYSNKVDMIIIGGLMRQDSVNNALQVSKNDYVVIHDGARPFIDSEYISFVTEELPVLKAITIGSRLNDTVHIVENNCVVDLIDRDKILAVQTPQCFSRELLMKVYKKALEAKFYGTDDISLVYQFSDVKPHIYVSTKPNIKFTRIEDIKMIEVLLDENR